MTVRDKINNGIPINVCSAFDGMSCGQIALRALKIKIANYYAIEISKSAIKATQHNYPNTIQLGDIRKVDPATLPVIDLFIGGSPCQGFSLSGKRLNLDDPRSKLFFDYLRLLNYFKSQNADLLFLLENVPMQSQVENEISKLVGINPVKINSSKVSAQNRLRLYWTNISAKSDMFGNITSGISQPKDEKIFLKSIIEPVTDSKYFVPLEKFAGLITTEINNKPHKRIIYKKHNGHPSPGILYIREATKLGYAPIYPGDCFDAGHVKSKTRRGRVMHKKAHTLMHKSIELYHYTIDGKIRKLTPLEAMRLQTIPEEYFYSNLGHQLLTDNQIYECAGNGWTIKVIKHIFNHI